MTIKEFVTKNKPTIFFFFSILLSISFLSTQTITKHIRSIRIFFIYFFSTSYIPVYKIVNYPFDTFNKFIQLSYMYEENIKLKQLVKKLYFEKLNYSAIFEKNQNEQLVNELSKKYNYKLLSAEVISRDCKNWYNECIILVDTLNVLKEDIPVILYAEPDKFYFVGRIWNIEKNVAKVLLITNPLSMLPVRIRDKPIYGVLIGNSSVILSMDYILLEDDVRLGDVVITSGIGNMPEGIEIGKVIDISISSTGFKKATIKLNYNINTLKNLIIFLPPQQ